MSDDFTPSSVSENTEDLASGEDCDTLVSSQLGTNYTARASHHTVQLVSPSENTLGKASTSPFPTVRIAVRPFLQFKRNKLSVRGIMSRYTKSTKGDQLYDAWLSFTAYIRWLPVSGEQVPPQTIMDFRSGSCLSLNRLPLNSNWTETSQVARIDEYEGCTALFIKGEINSMLKSSEKELVIFSTKNNKVDLHNLHNMVLIRIVPWQMMCKRIKQRNAASLQLEKVRVFCEKLIKLSAADEMVQLVQENLNTPTASAPENTPGSSALDNFVNTVRVPSDMVKNVMYYIETGFSIMKQIGSFLASSSSSEVTNANTTAVASTAQLVPDITKCVSIVTGIFQLMAVGVQIAVLYSKSPRGPRLIAFIAQLYQKLGQSIQTILDSNNNVGELQLEIMFRTLEKTLALLARTENECMNGLPRGSELKIIEEKTNSIEMKVSHVSTMATVHELSEDLDGLANERQKRAADVDEMIVCGEGNLKHNKGDFLKQLTKAGLTESQFNCILGL